MPPLREQHLVSLAGLDERNALGLLFDWIDDFASITPPQWVTTLYEWSQEYVPQPLEISNWVSNWTSCGLDGFVTVYRIRLAWTGGPGALNIDTFDGTGSFSIPIPATAAGQYQKVEFVPPPNKAQLFRFSATGTWRPMLEDSEVVVCQWGRTGTCTKCPGLGGQAN
jgi:hypothetical protein